VVVAVAVAVAGGWCAYMHDLGEHVRVVAHSRFDVEEGIAGHDHMFIVTVACHQTRNIKNMRVVTTISTTLGEERRAHSVAAERVGNPLAHQYSQHDREDVVHIYTPIQTIGGEYLRGGGIESLALQRQEGVLPVISKAITTSETASKKRA
jgi:hypothetical protein